MQGSSGADDRGQRGLPPEHVRFRKAEIEQSIPDRFECMVEMHPERTAMSDCGEHFTYERLNEEGNRIADTILEARGDREEPAAFLLEQGAAAVIAIIGILKAGKIYVALDPSLPRSELNRVMADCRPGLLVTNTKHLALTADIARSGTRCLNMDDAAGTCTENPRVDLVPTRLAYIFYTSGSTGPPKGVVDCHRNVLHNVMRYTNNLGIVSNDRLSLVQSCSFSGTVSSLFSALLNGATVCPFDLHNEGIRRLADWVGRERITIFHSVPMIFEQLVATGNRFDSLRIIRLEGDQTYRRHVDQFQQHFDNGCVLVNGLGTTETGIIRQHFINSDSPLRDDVVPVGYAVEDMEVRLIGERGLPVPPGAAGEISVRSRYLANGYWGRADLTARAFRSADKDADRRTYATGDIGRLRSDDCLEYLGRKDSRVKLRGQTIDVAQIENALCDIDSVSQAAVVAHDAGDGRQRLVAYLVTVGAPVPTVSALRRDLAESLPAIMLPARYVFLEELPIDRHNKLKRRALPQPNRDRPPLDQAYVAPETARQKAIASCFGEVLSIDEVGLNDDFSELGGDSLMATELLFLIQKKLGVACPAERFFLERTVAAVDRSLESSSQQSIAVPLQPAGARPPLFCLHNHVGHVLEYQKLAQLLGPDQPVFGIQSRNIQSYVDFRLEDMAARYLEEVQRTQPSGPYYLCGHCFGGVVAFELAQQLRGKGEEVAVLALIDTAYPIGKVARLSRRLRIKENWRDFLQMSMRESLLSLAGKLHRFSRWGFARFRRRIQFGVARRSRASDPQFRQESLTITDFHRQLEERYKPRTYGGKMTLICLDVRENQLGWKRIGRHGLKIVQLARQDSRFTDPHLIDQPYVRDLAAELRKLLGDQDNIG